MKRKLQAYHSSDEEEGGEDAPIKKKKKPPVIGEGYDPLALLKVCITLLMPKKGIIEPVPNANMLKFTIKVISFMPTVEKLCS